MVEGDVVAVWKDLALAVNVEAGRGSRTEPVVLGLMISS